MSTDNTVTEHTSLHPNINGTTKKLRIAVAGCSHGEMDIIYETMAELERRNGYKFDILICCGDYQSIRNYGDLAQMHVPDKFKSLGTFYQYYNGDKVAPVLTIFVGGNHEASGYLCELPNGGWVAPRIYYMGFSNVIRFSGLSIGGLSGIFKPHDFRKGHYEHPPFEAPGSLISAYHVRNLDVWRLRQLRPLSDDCIENSLDIMITHDWPAGITDYGDVNTLLREKPFFREDIEKVRLGNPATMELLRQARPRYWFAAHLHCKFAALVPHTEKKDKNYPEPTRFLALNKPIPKKHFLQAVEIDIASDANTTDLFYDPRWLAILKSTDCFTSTSSQPFYLPSQSAQSGERWDFRPTDAELKYIERLGDLKIPVDFLRTAPPSNGSYIPNAPATPYYRNPQSTKFCEWLGISDLNKMLADLDPSSLGTSHYLLEVTATDPGEINLDDEDVFGDEDFVVDTDPKINEVSSLNFEAPVWKGLSSKVVDKSNDPLLKRRKVDIVEDE